MAKQINELRYQLDVMTTLVDNYKEKYTLWIDNNNRMIETINGVNRQITESYELVKNCNMFGYEVDDVNIKRG